jgi:Integrase core domain
MDGKGAWRDNVFVERLWRSVKYEEVYLNAYDSVGEARRSIGLYLDFYNGRRPHSSLDDATPDQALLQPAADPHGSLTSADAPLIKAGILFRQPEPPLSSLSQTTSHARSPTRNWPATVGNDVAEGLRTKAERKSRGVGAKVLMGNIAGKARELALIRAPVTSVLRSRLAQSGSAGRSAELFPEAALNQTDETPD